MSSRDTIRILVAIIGAAGLVIAALITGIFALLVEQTKTNASATNVAATYVAQRTVDAPLPQATYILPPTSTPLPTQAPYPTIKPNVTIVTPKPTTVIPTASADQQDPPSGSIAQVGQGYTKNDITIRLKKSIATEGSLFGFTLIIQNSSNQTIVVLFTHALFHVKDDKGKVYHNYFESDTNFGKNRQFTIPASQTFELNTPSINCM